MNTSAAPPILDRLSALGDETRTRILSVLELGELTVSELCAALHLAQPTVSRHLKTLASEGWVEARVDGRNRHYRLSRTLDPAASDLWRIVHKEIAGGDNYAQDAERAVSVLDARKLRSSAYFAETAAAWDDVRSRLFGSATGLAPLLGLLPADAVVGDLGAGTGALSARLAPFVERVVAIDRSSEMLSAAQARVEEIGNVEVRRGELEALPLADDSLDLAILGLVLHYVSDPAAVLSEAHRVLRPASPLLLLDMRPHERGPVYAEEMGHVWPGFEPEMIAGWLSEAGFTEIRTVLLPPDPDAEGPLLFLTSARSDRAESTTTSS